MLKLSMPHRLRQLSAAAAAVCLLTACAPGSGLDEASDQDRTAESGATSAAGDTPSSPAPGPQPPSDDNAAPAPQPEVSTPSAELFGFATSSLLSTTNAASAYGVASGAQLLSGRLFPAPFVPGPGGQLVANTDLARTEIIHDGRDGQSLRIRYELAEDAVFSDGVPLTCTDYLLAITAGQLPELFLSHLPLSRQVEQVHCQPGARDFEVVFAPGTGARWRGLFGPGTVVPAHVLAQRLDLSDEDLVAALYRRDPQELAPLAQLWREGFDTEDFDPQLQVSFGPYLIDHIGPDGEVVLRANTRYYGDAPEISPLVLWPRDSHDDALAAAAAQGSVRVADIRSVRPDWLAAAQAAGITYEDSALVGELTDTLLISDYGVLASPESRQAFAACIDPAAVARSSGAATGVDTPAHSIHTVSAGDPLAGQLADSAAGVLGPDLPRAAAAAGLTVRIGYLGPNERYQAMVAEIARSCEAAGITIEELAQPEMSPAALYPDPETLWPAADIYLGAVDPLREYDAPLATIDQLPALRQVEQDLWHELDYLPLAAQPRVFLVDPALRNVVAYTGISGLGWNMDRWSLADSATSTTSTSGRFPRLPFLNRSPKTHEG